MYLDVAYIPNWARHLIFEESRVKILQNKNKQSECRETWSLKQGQLVNQFDELHAPHFLYTWAFAGFAIFARQFVPEFSFVIILLITKRNRFFFLLNFTDMTLMNKILANHHKMLSLINLTSVKLESNTTNKKMKMLNQPTLICTPCHGANNKR